jgi:flagellar basal-body rod modification protein FlgD
MSQITGFTPLDAAGAAASPRANRFSDMSTEDFIKIIFTELSHQDPFQPNDSAALLEQLNSIRSIESDLTLVEQLRSLVLENQLASASNLIGKQVSGLTADAQRVNGQVISVLRQGEDVLLELDSGHLLAMDSIEAIVNE